MAKKIQLITDPKKKLFKLLLEDPRISGVVLTNGEIPESIHIHDDGSVTFGRTPKKWWNWFWRDQVNLDFESVSIRMLKAFTKYLPKNSGLSELLTKDIIDNAINSNNYEEIIDRFVMYAFLGVTEGDYKLNKLKLIDEDPRQQHQKNGSGRKLRAAGKAYVDFGGCQFPLDMFIEEY